MSKELLFSVTRADLRIDTFRAGGKGGQNQNKVETGVRITHVRSGAVGEARDTRSQLKNKRAAYRRMVATPKFQAWLRIETARQLGQAADLEATVDAMMKEVLVEYL
jgi:protein subunit release factor B